ncbi:MAG: BatA domain-containing protein, partial [Prevotellaceae bacterium]|nr:BatA domain-containing protein [Prevotellaceae bacterium]
MRFDDPTYLYFLLIVPIFIIVHYATELIRKKRLVRFGNPELIISSGDKPSALRREIKFWLLMCALTAVIMMIARP